MKRSQLLAVTVLALLFMSALPVQGVHAQSSYSEKLNVYVAGSDALWYFTFGGVNGSAHLSALESTPSLSWYNVTAVSTAGWQSDFQVFGPLGYNLTGTLLGLPSLPPQGLFLRVGSDSYADAAAAAAALDPYLVTNFVSMSNGTGTYAFYSPVSFSSLVPSTLLKFLPTSEHGFASAISASNFMTTPSPFVVLEGTKSGLGFDHSLVVGSIAYSALSAAGIPTVLSYFGATVPTLAASNSSSSSVIQLKTLDGVIRSTDAATVTSNSAAFTGSYTLTLAPGKHISKVNATVVEQAAPLLATRAVDVGVLRTGTDMAVTLTFTNLSPSYSITNITYADNWWSSAGGFKFLSGVDNLSSAVLGSGLSTTPVYRLEYTGSATGPLTIPASVVRYRYQVGSATFNATAVLNPITLSLNADDAVVYAILTPVGKLGLPAGSSQSMNITVVNVGTLPASSVFVGGQSIAGLAAKTGGSPGGTATVTVKQSSNGLAGVNVTRSYVVTYQDPNGNNLQATTNVISDVFSHAAMLTGFPALTVGVSVSPITASLTNVTIGFIASNLGLTNITSFKAVGTLPAGLGCGKVSGTGIACSGNQVTISYPLINKTTTERTFITYNVISPENYIIPPLTFQGNTSGLTFTGVTNAAAAPAGLQLTKVFTPAQLFGGMTSSVGASAVNAGSLQVFNATVTTTADSFDTLASSASLTKSVPSIQPGGNVTSSYRVAMSQTYGNFSGTPVSATFYFAGTAFNLQGPKPRVQIYQPLSVTIGTYPVTPEEGKTFTINVQITNPSGVQVSGVLFSLPVPQGLSLSGLQNAQLSAGTLTVTAGNLGPGANVTATASAVASSGITIPFSGAKLTFSYAGTTVNGVVPKTSGIGIAEDVTTRYVIPTAIVLVVMLAVAFYLRRAASSGLSSPK